MKIAQKTYFSCTEKEIDCLNEVLNILSDIAEWADSNGTFTIGHSTYDSEDVYNFIDFTDSLLNSDN